MPMVVITGTGYELLEGASWAVQERRDVLGDPFGVAVRGLAERLRVHLRDLPAPARIIASLFSS